MNEGISIVYMVQFVSHFYPRPKHINFLVGFYSHHSFQTSFEHQSYATSYFKFWDARNLLAYLVNYLVGR